MGYVLLRYDSVWSPRAGGIEIGRYAYAFKTSVNYLLITILCIYPVQIIFMKSIVIEFN